MDVEVVSDTIRRALSLGGGRPDLEAMAELEERLRGHINLLLPIVEAEADRLCGGGLEWARRMHVMSTVPAQSERVLSNGPLSAHVHIAQLARDCQWLLDRHRGGVE
ncbi:DUF6415 family natural product biosynthesis protein [Streptomyces sp. NPDC050161]|uniref:DUF6415 family natural product biosynthesis protein n=1 Tax=Streptomyces sp. NPDC050161 TaxID=3365604 RepID=UPI00379C05BD